MKCDRLLNRDIITEVAALGHTEYLVIADCGLPVPKGVKSIDVSITAGMPSFLDVLNAVTAELVVESVIVAEEMDEKNEPLAAEIRRRYAESCIQKVPHETFKELTQKAKCIIRTGETTSYANVILIGGVNF